MIKLTKVWKTVHVEKQKIDILKDCNLEVNQGDFVVITGPSGSGKSTLLNILGGLDTYTAGEYWMDGKKIQSEKDRYELRRHKLSMIVQNFALLPRLSVKENIDLAKKDEQKAEELMRRLNIANLKNKKVKNLSGGEKQRVAIVRALIKNPKILLADEPTGALDSVHSQELVKLLFELNRQGLTIIMVTHNLQIAEQIDKHYQMIDGWLTPAC